MVSQAQALLESLEQDRSLLEPDRLHPRCAALDALELWFPDEGEAGLGERVQRLRQALEAANTRLCETIRGEVRRGRGREALLRWLPAGRPEGRGYDSLDELVGGVLRFEPPGPVAALAPEMVFYQPTPARHVLDLIARTALGPGDVLVDLGCGLGQVPLLAAICTPARAIGVDIEPAYVTCARRSAAALNLAGVEFVAQDARTADVSSGTLFYLYTPFSGAILREVLERLRREAARRSLRICTFGPCTATVAAQPWLRSEAAPEPDRVTMFRVR